MREQKNDFDNASKQVQKQIASLQHLEGQLVEARRALDETRAQNSTLEAKNIALEAKIASSHKTKNQLERENREAADPFERERETSTQELASLRERADEDMATERANLHTCQRGLEARGQNLDKREEDLDKRKEDFKIREQSLKIAELKRSLDVEKSGNRTNFLRDELHRTLEILENEKANNLTDTFARHVQQLERELTSEKTANRTRSLEKDVTSLKKDIKMEKDRRVELGQQAELLQQQLTKERADTKEKSVELDSTVQRTKCLENELNEVRANLKHQMEHDHTFDLNRQVAQLQIDLSQETSSKQKQRHQAALRTKVLEDELAATRGELQTQRENDRTVELCQEVEQLQFDNLKVAAANKELQNRQAESELMAQNQSNSLEDQLAALKAERHTYDKNHQDADLLREVEKLQAKLEDKTTAYDELLKQVQKPQFGREEPHKTPSANRKAGAEAAATREPGSQAHNSRSAHPDSSFKSFLPGSRATRQSRQERTSTSDVSEEEQPALRQRIGDRSPQRRKPIKRAEQVTVNKVSEAWRKLRES